MNVRKSLTWYLIISFGLAWILFLLPIPLGPPESAVRRTVAAVCMTAAMWAPGLAALLVTRFVDRQPLGNLNLKRLGEKRAYLWAWFFPMAFVILTGLLTWALGLGKLDLEFTQIKQAMSQAPGGAAVSPVLVVLLQALIALTLGPLFNTLFAVGEELGWRGFLFPKLLPLGQWRAIFLTGVIWGIWHAPVILQGHNYPGHPILGVFLMIGFCLLLGAILSWLYLRTLSPWAPALAHGAINAVAGLPLMFLTGVDMALGGTVASLTGWIPMILFIGWLVWSKRLPVVVDTTDSPPGLIESDQTE